MGSTELFLNLLLRNTKVGSRPHRLRKGALAAEVVAAPEVLSHRHDPGAPDGEGGGRPLFLGRAPLGTRGQELSCIVLPQRTNSSTVGLAWVAAFESKGRSVQYQAQLSVDFPEKSYFNFTKNKNNMDFCKGD